MTKSSRKMDLQPKIVARWDSWKNNSRTRGVSVWNQIESVFNGKNIKRKPLTNTSQVKLILTLHLINSKKNWGLKVKIWSTCADEKNTLGVHDMIPRVQIIPDGRDEHIKLKLLAIPSRWTYALLPSSSFSSKKSGLQRLMPSSITGNTQFRRDTRCEPSNPNQVHLQRGAYQTKALDRSFKNHMHT